MRFLFVGTITEKTTDPNGRLAQLDFEAKAGKYKVLSHEKGSDYIKVAISFMVRAKNEEKASAIIIDYLNTKTSIKIIEVERTVKIFDVNDVPIVDQKKVNFKEVWKV